MTEGGLDLKVENIMARLVAVCRENEEDYPFLPRQIPLYVDDSLTMVMEFSDGATDFGRHVTGTSHWKQFAEGHHKLKQQDLTMALTVLSGELYRALSQMVPCVGCRRSVERLFSNLVESETLALEPLTVKAPGKLSVTKACLADMKKLYSLFYIQGSKLNDVIDAIPKSRKSNRCQLHSLDTNKLRPLGGSWMDVWERMSQECRDEVVLVDSACLLETLERHLQKHRFCTDCKNKVLRAYNILIGEVDSSEEKDYCAVLYEGLCCCPRERHIHVCYETDFIAHLLGRAEPEFAGGYEERHAKTIDIAQEEVLTCLGIHLYERLHRIWQKLRAEEQTWQILYHLGIDELRKSFEMAVEKIQGISRLEQFVEEQSEKERVKQLKQEKKRQKRKIRRNNKCSFDNQEEELKEKDHEEGCPEAEEHSCNACRSHDEGESICKENSCANANTSSSCPCKQDLSSYSTASDCGYSSAEISENGSREGSDIACSEGLCNHDEIGESIEDKEEEGTDSCVDFWPHIEEKQPCKSKKKKRKGHNHEVSSSSGGSMSHSAPPSHICQTKDLNSSLCCDKTEDGFALKLQSKIHQRNLSLDSKLPEPNMSLMDLLDDSEVMSDEEDGLTQDEIQTFLERHQLFCSNRHKYRQLLKEKFTNYCCGTTRNSVRGKPNKYTHDISRENLPHDHC
ncbi:gametogenetin-binding protein 2 isoform X1 [Nerophis lumbriciformis]|uniref:gametogenetin-binding protein 2 isoform X1 n=2 Tax=Nerophis lumbriciformis TaxID=546530 RepID=UPI002AE06F52|nr:gametogenetin-binding protein 2-like isoform X1 [Nerophis lumbriciformis]XP_061819283.1 gametogenetin-binding protein 2-like isoform X1 [Nerophis lumbriciformis]